MIIAPYKAPAFYTCVFGKAGASLLASKLSTKYAEYINNAYVISIDANNDIEPSAELIQACVNVHNELALVTNQELSYNPSYIPSAKSEINKNIEYDEEGNISAISGFNNPYITLSVKQSTQSPSELIFDGFVSYKPFELPSLSEIINPNHGNLAS